MSIDIYKLSETNEIECKEASGGLPKDLWETYSAFANSNGGIILLGIKEKNGNFSVQGLDNIDKIKKDLWDNLNNPKKVSANIISDENVSVKEYNEKFILEIVVPRADRRQKPVYIGENPYSDNKHGGTFRRNHSGDYKCTKNEIDRMIADSLDKSQDGMILEGFTIDDLDIETISNYRNRLGTLKPSHPWIGLDLKTFLYRLGAYGKDRVKGIEGVTAAGLLMFGQEREILEEFPKYFLDYREKFTENRWDYRTNSSEGTWSGNIYDFYFKIINRITDNLNVPFKLISGIRQEDTRVHDAIREAVANAIIHADYSLERGIVIERQNTYFKFSNPGSLRISIEEAMNGGISDPRNVNIFKMFNLIGVGERAGSGLENIGKAWKEQEWETPNLNETYNPDRVELILSTNSLLPKESVDFIKNMLGDEYNNLDKDEKMALVTAHHEGSINNRRLQTLVDNNSLYSNKILSSLVKMGYLDTKGKARGTKYILSNKFDNEFFNDKNNNGNNIKEKIDKNNKNLDLSNSDEIKIIEFIEINGYITNAMARENFGFGSTKVKNLFNKLIKTKKINKEGSGPQTRYVLNEK